MRKFKNWVCRFFANTLPVNYLRIVFFKLSGCSIGEKSFINTGFIVIDDYEGGKLFIGRRVAIAPAVKIICSSHPNDSKLSELGFGKTANIIIEDDVWLGASCVIQPGIRIGHTSIVAANAVVTSSVEPFSIVAGIPARKIGDTRLKSFKSQKIQHR